MSAARAALPVLLLGVTLWAQGPASWQQLNDAGRVAFQRGDYKKAEKQFISALRVAQAQKDDDAVAATHIGLAMVRSAQRKHDDAASHLQAALVILQGKYGPEHPNLFFVLDNLGNLALREGNDTGALDLHRRAIAVKKNIAGSDQAQVAAYYLAIADRYTALTPEWGPPLGRKWGLDPGPFSSPDMPSAGNARSQGPTATASGSQLSPTTRQSGSSWDVGAYAANPAGGTAGPRTAAPVTVLEGPKAKPRPKLMTVAAHHYREAAVIYTEQLGPTKPLTLQVRLSAARAFALSGDNEEAARQFASLVPDAEKEFGSDAIAFASYLLERAEFAERTQRYEQAAEDLKWAMVIQEKTLPRDSPAIAEVQRRYAAVQKKLESK